MDPAGAERGDGVGGGEVAGEGGARLSAALAAEEAHCRRALAAGGVEPLKRELLREMRDMWLGEGQDPPPERYGPYVYSAVTGSDGGLEAYVRRRVLAEPAAGSGGGGSAGGGGGVGSPPEPQLGGEEVLLDRLSVAADAALAARMTGLALGDTVGCLKLCPAHRQLAYTLPLEGRPDVFCALVRDTASGRLLLPGGVVGGVAGPGGLELGADGRSLLVLTPDEAGRPARAMLHDLTCAAPPLPLLAERDPRFFLGLGRTKDAAFLLLSSNSKTCSEVHLLDAARPRDPGALRLVQRRKPGLEYFVEHHRPPTANRQAGGAGAGGGGGGGSSGGGGGGGRLIILTNADLPVPAAVSAARGDGVESTAGGVSLGVGAGAGGGARRPVGRELRVAVAPLERPGLESWAPLLALERPGVVVTDMDLFEDHLVLYERRGGLPAVSVLCLTPPEDGGGEGGGAESAGAGSAGQPVQVPLPRWALHVSPGINADPRATHLRLAASGPLHPPATFNFCFATGALTQLATQPVPRAAAELLAGCSLLRLEVPSGSGGRGGDDDGDYDQGRGGGGGSGVVGAQQGVDGGRGGGCGGDGGVRVPVTLVLPPGVSWPAAAAQGSVGASVSVRLLTPGGTGPAGAGDGPAAASWAGLPGPRPVLVSVYGAYGMPLELEYDATALSLLSRGWALAKVHARGGGELGRSWHAAGVRRRKRAGAEDCLAAARALAAAGLTAPGLLAGHAISAGGVALAGAMACEPSLWGAAVLRCAFLELLGPATDPAGQPLAAHEWDEWGDPADPRDMAAMARACPYEALAAPGLAARWRAAVLASCAEEDPRVYPGIPAKWVARLRRRLREHHSPRLGGAGAADGVAGGTGGGARSGGSGGGGGGQGSRPDGAGSVWRRLRRVLRFDLHDDSATALTAPSTITSGTADAAAAGSSGTHDGGSSGGAGGESGSSGSGGRASLPPPAPLLRVHRDGTGHVRLGAAAAEEEAEEAAFLLVALAPLPPPSPDSGAK